MVNPYHGRAVPLGGPATDIVAVVPNDSQDLPVPALALYVEGAGTVKIETLTGAQTRTVAVGDGMLLPVAVRRVRATGTTATGIHALVVR